jgi:two-component system, OmpR family, sensor histidine kinase VicK
MRIHFFGRADQPGRFAFYSYYVLQNLKTVRAISLVYFLFCVLIRVIFFLFHLPEKNIHHIRDYDTANWLGLFTTPVFYGISLYLIKRFRKRPKMLMLAQTLTVIFAIFVVICGMRASFFSMYNPRNTLVLYLLGLIMVCVFFTLEYHETLIIALATQIVFMLMIPQYQHTISELALNNLASLLLVTVFFCISRYFYSYRADNFFKLKSIEQKNLEIETASLIKNEILGVVAHDLRNPLAIIKSASALMELEDINDEVYNYLQMINASCDKATAIIHDLIETAQNDENRGEFELIDTNINEFLSTIVDEWLKNKKESVGITYCDAGHTVHTGIQREKMQRVMDNLISNALKFSGEDDHIEIKLTDSADAVFISVEDFGIGIPQEYIPHLFDRFSVARRNGLRGETSVGLGLNIVHQIVKKHHGEIEVESTEQAGTTFTITLPKIFA